MELSDWILSLDVMTVVVALDCLLAPFLCWRLCRDIWN